MFSDGALLIFSLFLFQLRNIASRTIQKTVKCVWGGGNGGEEKRSQRDLNVRAKI